jgi:hypothetical protein
MIQIETLIRACSLIKKNISNGKLIVIKGKGWKFKDENKKNLIQYCPKIEKNSLFSSPLCRSENKTYQNIFHIVEIWEFFFI